MAPPSSFASVALRSMYNVVRNSPNFPNHDEGIAGNSVIESKKFRLAARIELKNVDFVASWIYQKKSFSRELLKLIFGHPAFVKGLLAAYGEGLYSSEDFALNGHV